MAKKAKKGARDARALFGPEELIQTINQIAQGMYASPDYQANLFNIWRAGNALEGSVKRTGRSTGLSVLREGLAGAYTAPLIANMRAQMYGRATELGAQNVGQRMNYSQYLTNLYNQPGTFAKILGGLAGGVGAGINLFRPRGPSTKGPEGGK